MSCSKVIVVVAEISAVAIVHEGVVRYEKGGRRTGEGQQPTEEDGVPPFSFGHRLFCKRNDEHYQNR